MNLWREPTLHNLIMLRTVQYIGVVVSGIFLFLLDSLDKNYAVFFCLALILFLGIPHGAIDHKIHQTTSSQKNILKYVVTYLLISAGYVIWWVLDPVKALFIFFILSSYHFGQELLEDTNVYKSFNPITSLLWGLIVLIAPILFNPLEIDSYIFILTGYSLEGTNGSLPILCSFMVYSVASIHLIYAYSKKNIHQSNLIQLVLFVAINTVLHLVLDFILAFTLYFVFFHSLNAFKHQYRWLSSLNKYYSIKKFVKDLVGFSLIAIIGILLFLLIAKPNTQASLITTFFILISIITLPHAITLDHFYKVKKKFNHFHSIGTVLNSTSSTKR